MNNMQMNGMQPGQPGAMMMQQHQQQQQLPNGAMAGRPAEPDVANTEGHKLRLNTAIYDYFLKLGAYELARNLKQSSLPLQLQKSDGSLKRKAEDDDGNDDPNRPADLPSVGFPLQPLSCDTAFLLDWFSIFFDLFANDKNKGNSMAGQYLQHTQNLNRMQQQQQQTMMRQSMMPQNAQQQMAMMRNPMMMRNGQNMMTQQQQQQMMNRQRLMQANMQRDGSQMDVDGNRPRTPSSGDNAPSPNKRPRIESQPFGSGMMNGMPGQMSVPNNAMNQQRAQNLLVANGIDPSGMTAQQMQTFGAQNAQRANMAAGQSSPNMMNPGMDMQAMQGGNNDFYNNGNMNRAGGVNGQNGHALQDYQQQLMLLERQNRKRLEMAKQEQEVGGFQGPNGSMNGMQFAPNMSPSGSRQGPSPNPNDMKRATPQLKNGQMPGSPMPDGGARSSPGMNYNGMGGPGMENGMRPGPNGMQPPSSHPSFQNGAPGMNPMQMRNAQGGPVPNGQGFQQGPMGPGNQQPGANGQIGTPRAPNAAMGPPAGPPAAQNATGRAPSPAPSATASTPQTTNKPAPKKKKDAKERKPSTKKTNNSAATPAENADTAPAASAPATPITPAVTNANNAAFDKNKAASAPQANGAPVASAPQPVSQPAAPVVDMNHGQDASMMPDFTAGDLDFANIEAGDVLDQFNFDAFIDDSSGNLDNFNFDMGGFDNSMEAGIGEA